MKIFVDANILIAVLNKEYPLYSSAAKVLSLADKQHIILSTSPTCIAIAFYFASKKHGEAFAKSKIEVLLRHIGITTTDENCTKSAIKNTRISDLEDGIQYYSALNAQANYIITEDLNGFFYSEIPVLKADIFLKQIMAIR